MDDTLAFDVYGTLIDPQGITDVLNIFLDDSSASGFARMWREKQLEYSFRRGLMQNYQTFAVCTREALEYTCAYFNLQLETVEKQRIMNAYAVLPAFADVHTGLEKMRNAGFKMYAFSNGTAEAVNAVLSHAGLKKYFLDIVSVDEVRSFKPNPGVYGHFLRRTSTTGNSAWLVSSNPFDVLGALSAGMKAVWVKRRSDMLFDPWGMEPTMTVKGVDDFAQQLIRVQ